MLITPTRKLAGVRVSVLSREDDVDLKRLAEMKAYLEKKIADLERETSQLRSFLGVVDSLLAEKSFRHVKITSETQVTTAPEKAEAAMRQVSEVWPITTPEGTHLADLQITETELTLVPDPSIRYETASPPLRAFLVARVLDPMHSKDEEASRTGQLGDDKVLTYDVQDDKGILKAVCVRNYGDQRRLAELRNAMRWTIRRMYEKTLQAR